MLLLRAGVPPLFELALLAASPCVMRTVSQSNATSDDQHAGGAPPRAQNEPEGETAEPYKAGRSGVRPPLLRDFCVGSACRRVTPVPSATGGNGT